MRQFNEHQEVQELLNELQINEIEYTLAEHNKVFIDVLDEDDTLEGVYSIQYEPMWSAYKVIYYYLEGNEIQGEKTVAWDIQQVLENVLG